MRICSREKGFNGSKTNKILFLTIFPLFGCQSEAEIEAAKSSRIAESQAKYEQIVEEERLKTLSESGVSVLHYPPEKKHPSEFYKTLQEGICYDVSNLAKPWFFTDANIHIPARRFSTDLVIVASSDDLNIPYYEVNLQRPVHYEFVSPYQEFFYVWIHSVPKDFDKIEYFENLSNFHLAAETGWETLHYKAANKYDLANADWPLKAYTRDHRPGDKGTNFILINKDRKTVIKAAHTVDSETPTSITSSLRPTAEFYKTPTMRGGFLHKSGRIIVNFEGSSLALPHSPRILNLMDDAVDSLIIDCK